MPAARLALATLLLASACAAVRPTDSAVPLPVGTRGPGSAALRPSRPALRELLAAGTLTRRAGRFPAYAATARVPSVAVHDGPRGRLVRRLAHPQPSGAPLTFLVRADRGEWIEVYLPVRPNGSTGWVAARDVAVRGLPYRIDVLRSRHLLVLYEHGRVAGRFPVGIGTRDTPTPGGTFYLKELIRPTNPGGFYGPYAYGLSGFSPVYRSYAGGEGVIGLHGTDDERSVGRDVSHGCIRMRNADIARLAALLPLGTPVRVLP